MGPASVFKGALRGPQIRPEKSASEGGKEYSKYCTAPSLKPYTSHRSTSLRCFSMAKQPTGSAEALSEAERVAHGVFGLEAPRAFALAGDTERNFRVTHGPAGARRDVLLRLFVSGLDAERIAFQRALVDDAQFPPG